MKENRKAYASLCSAMLIFGTIAIFRRNIPFSSGLLAFSRGLLGGVFLLIFVAVKHHRMEKVEKKQLALLILSGAIIGVDWILLFEAYNCTTVAVATMCFYMQPTIVILLSPILFREKLSVKKGLCALAAILGMVFVSGVAEGAPPGAQDAKGIAFGLAAAVLYAATVIINKKIKVEDAYEKTIVQLLSAAAVLIPYLLLTEDFSAVVLDARTVVLVLIVGIVHSGLAYALYFGNVNKLPAQSVAVLSYIDPVSSLFFSALLLHERLTAIGILGAVLIFGSALVSELGGKKHRQNTAA